MKIFILCSLLLLFSQACRSQTGENEKQYFFVFLNTNPDKEELPEIKVNELQEGHMNNIIRLANEGKLIIAGPLKGGGGIFVLYASSLSEAKNYLETDPAVKANRFKLEVYPMKILNGKLCAVKGENYTMANYTLVRYNGNISISDKSPLLLQSDFKDQEDGVMIFNYDLEKGNEEVLKNYFEAEKLAYIKTLWIAKGSFCE